LNSSIVKTNFPQVIIKEKNMKITKQSTCHYTKILDVSIPDYLTPQLK